MAGRHRNTRGWLRDTVDAIARRFRGGREDAAPSQSTASRPEPRHRDVREDLERMPDGAFNNLVRQAFGTTSWGVDRKFRDLLFPQQAGTPMPDIRMSAPPTNRAVADEEIAPARTAIPPPNLDALSRKQKGQVITAFTKVMVYVAEERGRRESGHLQQATRKTIERLQERLGDPNLKVLTGGDPKELLSRRYDHLDQDAYAHALNMLDQSLSSDCKPDSIRLNAPSAAAIAAVRKFSERTQGRADVERALDHDIVNTQTGETHRLQLDDASRSNLVTALDALDSMERNWLYSKNGREYASAYAGTLPAADVRSSFEEGGTNPTWAAGAAQSLLQARSPLLENEPASALGGWGS
jgi:hypothetical protein